MSNIVKVKVENSFNGYMFTVEGEPNEYFINIESGKPMRAYRIIENERQEKEEVIDPNILFSVFTEILRIKSKCIGGSMCQLIESWGDNEKVQNARKCLMWNQLERNI